MVRYDAMTTFCNFWQSELPYVTFDHGCCLRYIWTHDFQNSGQLFNNFKEVDFPTFDIVEFGFQYCLSLLIVIKPESIAEIRWKVAELVNWNNVMR
jgi:hypothetical protein